VLTPAWGPRTLSHCGCPKRILFMCAHYCECELICREIETYSSNAICKTSGIITDLVTPLSTHYETSSGAARSLLVQHADAKGF
jgi:hypothetical protein